MNENRPMQHATSRAAEACLSVMLGAPAQDFGTPDHRPDHMLSHTGTYRSPLAAQEALH